MTDEWSSYKGIEKYFDGGHHIVHHGAKEYARGDVYTNTAEAFFSLLKRGLTGAYHHVSKHHLSQYTDEFAFRWNTRKMTDGQRMAETIAQIGGKRLLYRDS